MTNYFDQLNRVKGTKFNWSFSLTNSQLVKMTNFKKVATKKYGCFNQSVFTVKNQNNFLNTILIVTLFVIVGLFPSVIYTFTMQTAPEYSIAMELLFGTFDIFNLLNYAVNPFLYFWRLQKYRKAFLVLYWKKAS